MKNTLLALLLFINAANAQKPQEPTDTSSYISHDVNFENTTDKVRLGGTLTLPKNKSDLTAVILISGSGPQDRNSELLGHKPFLVLADHLTKKGYAVLRVDDRGTGESEGNYNATGLDGFENDTKAAMQFLKSRKEINTSKIGLLGHSLGGVIAPSIAAKSDDVAFVIMLAGPGLRGDKLMLLQKEIFERKLGVPDAAIATGQKDIGGVYEIINNSGADNAKLHADVTAYFTKIYGGMASAEQIKTVSEQLSWPWFADFIRYDPSKVLPNVKCPVLALNGTNDTQVPAKENLAGIKTLVEKAANHNVTVIELPKLNHLFQESDTGMPQEYAKIEQTFSPAALDEITNWMLKNSF